MPNSILSLRELC